MYLKNFKNDLLNKDLLIPRYLSNGLGFTFNDILIFGLILNFTKSGVCYLSNKDFHDLTGLSVHTLLKSLAHLEELKFLTIEKTVNSRVLRPAKGLKQKNQSCFRVPYKWLLEYKLPIIYCLIYSDIFSTYNSQKTGERKALLSSNEYFAKKYNITTRTVSKALQTGKQLKILKISLYQSHTYIEGTHKIKTVRAITPIEEKKKPAQEPLNDEIGSLGIEYDDSNNTKLTIEEIEAFRQKRPDVSDEVIKQMLDYNLQGSF